MYVCMYVVCLYFLSWESLKLFLSLETTNFILYRTYCKLQATGWVATIFVVCFTSIQYSVCIFWAYSLGYEAKLVRKN